MAKGSQASGPVQSPPGSTHHAASSLGQALLSLLLDLAGRTGTKQFLPSYTPPDEHSTASFVNLRLRIPGKNTGLPLRNEKVQVTSGLWGHPDTCYLPWSLLPFHFCLGWNYKDPPTGTAQTLAGGKDQEKISRRPFHRKMLPDPAR